MAAMRCILVSDANLKSDICCTYCRKRIGGSYAREIWQPIDLLRLRLLSVRGRNAGHHTERPRDIYAYLDGQLMMRCDHCRRQLDRDIHRYWQMRFCSPECLDSYRRRLGDGTRLKIRELDVEAQNLREGQNLKKPWLGGLIRSLPL
jgi:hypothetical protein